MRRRAERALAVLALWVALALPAAALPGLPEVRAAHVPSDLLFTDRQGEPLQTLRVDERVRRLPWVALADFSPALRVAVVLSEDRRFLEHEGVDWSGLARGAWATLKARVGTGGGSVQGGSTLTMQLAGLIDGELARPSGGRSLLGKIGQIAAARALEAQWRKPEILEAWLNLVPLRGELVGMPAAARVLLGKHPSGLDASEAALLAALVRAPNAGREAVLRRACSLLTLQGLGCEALEPLALRALARTAPARPLPQDAPDWAPHYARAARAAWTTVPGAAPARPDAAGRVRTPLEAPLQRLAVRTLRQQLAELAPRGVEDGAVLVLDRASGEVRAWVGSSGAGQSDAQAVDAVRARRQPGSTLKPFVYQLALERRLITPASWLHDAPARWMAAGGSAWRPQNYDRQFHGWVRARTALGASLNLPAVQLGATLGPDALFERLQAWGLGLAHSGGHHGPALALGTAEVTLLDLVNAYRALANGARWSSVALWPVLNTGTAATASRSVGSADAPAAAWLVGDMLADNAARALTFGLDSPLVTRGWAAVKTGTSKDMRDNWCIGWTATHVIGVWVGNASGAPMHQVSGASGAAPVWRALAQASLDAQTAAQRAAPVPPAGVVRLGAGAGSTEGDEVFLAGTEWPQWWRAPQATGAPGQAGPLLRGIREPRDGALYALDPDMPPAVQRIPFEGEAGQWWLDGRRVGLGERVAWAPQPGRHQLELRLADGRREAVRFEVRGARWREPATPSAAASAARRRP